MTNEEGKGVEKMYKYNYDIFLVEESKQPWRVSLGIMNLMLGIVLGLNGIWYGKIIIILSSISMIISIYNWDQEVKRESLYRGGYTSKVHKMLMEGFIWFIISEVMVFGSLFFVLGYSAINPSIELGRKYVSAGIIEIDYMSIPLFNTVLLFLSSVTITIGQYKLVEGRKQETILYIWITILLNLIFSYLQGFEYFYADNSMSDGIWGSNFFMTTGLHGLHVIIGTILAFKSLWKVINNEFTSNNYLFYKCTALYLHGVDAAWLLVLTLYYIAP